VAHRIRRFGIAQTAKTMGVLYFFLGLCVVPILFIVNAYGPESERLPIAFIVLLPVLYALIGPPSWRWAARSTTRSRA
jgi:hypothetical protein